MKKRNKSEGKHRYGLGIKGRLVLCFTCFVVFILAIIWICQIGLLAMFYKRTKNDELERAAEAIMNACESESLNEIAYSNSVKYHLCVRMFAVSAGRPDEELCSLDNSQVCLIHHMSDDALSMYYSKAIQNGGEYSETVHPFSFGHVKGEKRNRNALPADENAGNGAQDAGPDSPAPSQAQVFTVNVGYGSNGRIYVLFLDTEYAPLLSTVSTLNTQFIWISIGTVIIAAILAVIFARTISKPLIRMTQSARKMAAGDYSPDFAVAGYKETRVLAETLNYAASEISRSDRMQKELIANVSHDLRTPLTMISGYAEVMRDIPGENSPENLQVIIDESNHLSGLVNDLLDLSKMEAGTKTPQKTVFDLTETVNEVLGRYSALIMHNGYSIDFSAGENVCIYADRTMILQVIYNLINNAINYTGEDKKVFVTQEYDRESHRVRISVRDTGEGIAPENIPLIWERYYKVDRLHKRAAVGSGLGLSIVRNILQLHGASFGVESSVGNGSSFWFETDTCEPPENS